MKRCIWIIAVLGAGVVLSGCFPEKRVVWSPDDRSGSFWARTARSPPTPAGTICGSPSKPRTPPADLRFPDNANSATGLKRLLAAGLAAAWSRA